MQQAELFESSRPKLVAGYGAGDDMPIGGYAVLLGAWVTIFGTGLALVRDDLPKRFSLRDIALLGVATHKITRIAVRDWVTSPIRAPFVKFERSAGAGEVEETSRGHGLRRAVGDLVSCPWCAAPWVGGALLLGFARAPRLTRAIAALFAAVTLSDFLNHAYSAVKKLNR